MRKLFFTLLLSSLAFLANAQIPVFVETFDFVPGCTVSSGTPGWNLNTRLNVSAPNSDTTYIDAPNSESFLTSDPGNCPISTVGLSFVTLEFDHICKVEFFDSGTIEISTDGGVTWVQLVDNNLPTDNCIYLGGSPAFSTQNSKFQEASYAAWQPGQATVPDNTWWQHEVFDISQIAGNQADVRLRFRLWDENGSGNAPGRTGWALDNILVIAAPCELNPPNVTGLSPVYPPQVFQTGPFDVNVSATDASGIQSAILSYSVNGVPQPTIPLVNTMDSTYSGQIPAAQVGDTICYTVQFTDNSGCFNVTTFPSDTSAVCFEVKSGITFPYCDNFNINNNLWTVQTDGSPTSIWEFGDPFFGTTTGAFSPPNCWDVNITTGYTSNANTSLISPVFSFSTAAGATLSFMQNCRAEQGWDGFVLEYTFDDITTSPTPTWNVLGTQGCVNCVNWYNDATLNSSGLPAWTGNGGQPGWFESSIELDATFNNQPITYFRFRFTSDGIIEEDGVSIDDFCITLPQPDDVGVDAIITPGPNAPAGVPSDVTVVLKNFGINPQTTFDVTYGDGINPPVTETWNGNLAAGQTTNFTFTVQDTLPTGQFTICAWTTLPGDGNNFNDTTCSVSLGVPINTITFCDDFEGGNLGWQDSTSNGNTTWQLGAPSFNQTTGANSGTLAWDINLIQAYGTNADVFLKSPFYDLTGAVNPILSFWRNQNTAGNDGLRVQYALNGSATWQTLGTVNDPDGFNWYNNANIQGGGPGFANKTNNWEESRYFLQNIVGTATLIQFRLVFESGFNGLPNDGVSIDDFCVIQPGPCDVGVVAVNQPIDAQPAGTNSVVEVVIRNFGSAPQSNIDIEYTVDGMVMGSGNFPGPLNPGLTAAVQLTNLTIPSGAFTFAAYTQLPCDGDNTNDTLSVDRVGIPVITVDYLNPYTDDFDGTNVGWYEGLNGGANGQTIWELGTPNWGATSQPLTTPNAWDVNLNSAYGPNADCWLASPIFDIQGVDPELEFWLNYNTETNWDGTRLEYSVNGGPWQMLGGFGPAFSLPCWANWYSINNIISSGMPAWAGSSGNGFKVSRASCLSGFDPLFNNNQIQFRFVFTSDGSVNIDGNSLDDFSLTVPVPLSVGPTTLNTNTINNTFVFPGQLIDFNSNLTNFGTTPVDTLIATLTIDGQVVEVDTIGYNPALERDDFLNHLWNYQWTATPGVHDICVITSEPNFSPDLNPSDDTLCIQISVFDSVTVTSGNPYCTDFEAGPTWVSVNALSYIDGPANSFELGTPAQTIINGALSGTNAWMTNLTTNYIDSDSSGLFTPVFSIDETKCYRLSFSHIFDTEKNFDGGTVEYSIDNAQTWQQVGWASSSPDWFNTAFITGLGGIPGNGGWSGSQTSWQAVFQDVNFNNTGAATVIFRFRFQSDPSGSAFEGWAIDDFCFEEVPQPCVTNVQIPDASGLALGQNIPNPFSNITSIKFSLPTEGMARLFITDVLGKEVAVPVSARMQSGTHNVEFDAGQLAPGIYYYTLDFEGERVTRKMMVD